MYEQNRSRSSKFYYLLNFKVITFDFQKKKKTVFKNLKPVNIHSFLFKVWCVPH